LKKRRHNFTIPALHNALRSRRSAFGPDGGFYSLHYSSIINSILQKIDFGGKLFLLVSNCKIGLRFDSIIGF
jgi:hypothetical protein